jgi:SAM-dependent methyltransferase
VTEIANTDEYEAWNGDSGHRWVVDADRRDHILAPVADALLAAAQLGGVYGIDLSEPMLEVARRRADVSGLSNTTLLQGDVQTHRFTGRADVAISRFGTMFFADEVAGLANMRGALRPGGRLCIATWQPLEANDWLTIPGAALLRYGTLPDTEAGGRGMFAQSDVENVSWTLHAAGYADPQFQPVTLTLTLGADPDEAADYLAGTGPGRAALEAVPEDQRSAALDAVRAALADHTQPEGVRLGAAIWIITAGNPT